MMLLLGLHGVMFPQLVNATTYDDPVNTDCANALQFDGSLQFAYTNSEKCCLWFSFRVCERLESLAFTLTVNGGGKAELFTGGQGIDPCSGLPSCAVNGSANVLTYSQGSTDPGIYFIAVLPNNCVNGSISIEVTDDSAFCDPEPCEGCLPEFGPGPGKYVISAWSSEEGAIGSTTNFSSPKITLTFVDEYSATLGTQDIVTSGPVIDQWQRMEQEFEMPVGTVELKVELLATSGDVFFDDIRIFPADGSMKCYVYDPVNLRFVAELDERHYATFYEYDGEGKLARVKKETERGIMTIQEARYNSSKISSP